MQSTCDSWFNTIDTWFSRDSAAGLGIAVQYFADIIDVNQYAYQQKLSTTDALLQLLDDWTSALDQNSNIKFVQNAVLDFSKAFDRMQHPILLSKMNSLGFNSNVINLVGSFLNSRQQCVKFSGQFSTYKPIDVGAPQGTKLGPILWLIYVNDLKAEGFNCVKYADDTTFYKPIVNLTDDNVSDAISNANSWSLENSMLLNSSKTVVLNIAFSDRPGMNLDVNPSDDTFISPSKSAKLLGVTVDSQLSFSDHIDSVVSKCNSRLYLMKQLKTMGMNTAGLITFYAANVKPVLSYACPVWFQFISEADKEKLEKVQRYATRMMMPHIEHYDDRLTKLALPYISDFLMSLCSEHFLKISTDNTHPLNNRIRPNTQRKSARKAVIDKYRPSKCRTVKRQNSFFEFYMRFFN